MSKRAFSCLVNYSGIWSTQPKPSAPCCHRKPIYAIIPACLGTPPGLFGSAWVTEPPVPRLELASFPWLTSRISPRPAPNSAPMPSAYVASAPGKVILFGEHAVVYGKVLPCRSIRCSKGSPSSLLDPRKLTQHLLQKIIRYLWVISPKHFGCSLFKSVSC